MHFVQSIFQINFSYLQFIFSPQSTMCICITYINGKIQNQANKHLCVFWFNKSEQTQLFSQYNTQETVATETLLFFLEK